MTRLAHHKWHIFLRFALMSRFSAATNPSLATFLTRYCLLALLVLAPFSGHLQASQPSFLQRPISEISTDGLQDFYRLVKDFSSNWSLETPEKYKKEFDVEDIALLFVYSSLETSSQSKKNFLIDSWYLQSEELRDIVTRFWGWAKINQINNNTDALVVEELKTWLQFLLYVNNKLLEKPIQPDLLQKLRPNEYFTEQDAEKIADLQIPRIQLWQYEANLTTEQSLFLESAILAQSPHNIHLKTRYHKRLKNHYEQLVKRNQYEDALYFGSQLAQLSPSSQLYRELSQIASKQQDRQLQEYFLKQFLSLSFSSNAFFELLEIMLEKGQHLQAEELLLSEEKRLVLRPANQEKFLSLLMHILVKTQPESFASEFEKLEKKYGFTPKINKQAAQEFLQKAKYEFVRQNYFVAQTYTQRSLAISASLEALELEKKITEQLGFVEVRIDALLDAYQNTRDAISLQKAIQKDQAQSLQIIEKKPQIQIQILQDSLQGKLDPTLEAQLQQSLFRPLAQIPSTNRQINLLVLDYWKNLILNTKQDTHNLGSSLINTQLAYNAEKARSLYKKLSPYTKNTPVALLENLLDGIQAPQVLRHASLLHDYSLQAKTLDAKSIGLLLSYTRQARDMAVLLKLLETRDKNPKIFSKNESDTLNEISFAAEEWTKRSAQLQTLALYLEPIKAQKAEQERREAEEVERKRNEKKKKQQQEKQRLARLEQQKIRAQQLLEKRRKQKEEAQKRSEERKKQQEQEAARKKAEQQAQSQAQAPAQKPKPPENTNKTLPQSIDERLALLQSQAKEQKAIQESEQKKLSDQGDAALNANQQQLLLKAVLDFEQGNLLNARKNYIALFQILTDKSNKIPAKVTQKIKETSFVDNVENFSGAFDPESYWLKLVPFLDDSEYLPIYKSYIHAEAAIRFEKSGQFDTALAAYQVAINSYSRNKIALERLLSFAQSKNNTQLEFYALKRLDRFFGKQQDYSESIAEASLNLADYYWKLGQIEEARYYVKETLDLKPQHPKAQKLYEKITQN